mmetsp:Transcript_167994/g.534349  ORF Transcript_167994/g.534349 Transcript_167994/m.534349 type:complete len:241 (+) Transcript_167994:2141-2863(+)
MESDGQDVGHHVGGEQKSSVRCCVERGRPLVPVGNLRQPPAGAEAGQVSGEGELGLWAPQARGITVSGVARRSVAFLFSWCAALAVGLCGVLRRFEVVRRGRRAGREDDRRGVCGAHRRQLGEGRLVWFGHAPQLSGNLSSGAPQRCPGSPPPAPPRSPASPSPAAVQPPGTLGPYVDPAAIRRHRQPVVRPVAAAMQANSPTAHATRARWARGSRRRCGRTAVGRRRLRLAWEAARLTT